MAQVRHSFKTSNVCDLTRSSADLGKVLAGIQVPESDSADFLQFLQRLDYGYTEETENSVYRRFLRG